MWNRLVVQLTKIPKSFLYFSLSAYGFLILLGYFAPETPVSLMDPVPDPELLPKLKTKMTFHNTLIVDRFLPEDFAKKFPPPGNSLYQRIILTEQKYNESRLTRANQVASFNGELSGEQLLKYFPPSFQCPHELTRIRGKGKGTPEEEIEWNICGLSLYSKDLPEPPQECVIYMIRNSLEESGMEVVKQLGDLTKCHIHYFHSGDQPKRKEGRVNIAGKTKFYVKSGGDMKKALLRNLIEAQGHGWVDMLFFHLDGSQELAILEQAILDFVKVFATAQLYVRFTVARTTKFLESWAEFDKWLKAMEKKGFRPFYGNVRNIQKADGTRLASVDYGLFNSRGKHLLLGRGPKV